MRFSGAFNGIKNSFRNTLLESEMARIQIERDKKVAGNIRLRNEQEQRLAEIARLRTEHEQRQASAARLGKDSQS